MNCREEIKKKLDDYRSILKQSFGHPERRFALLLILRSVDFESAVALARLYSGGDPHCDETQTEVERLFGWGFNEAIELFWGDHVRQIGIPLSPTRQEDKEWADSLLQCCGRIRLIEHALALERIQLASISQITDKVFRCALTDSATGVESIERRDSQFFNVLIGRRQEREQSREKLLEKRQTVTAKMQELVRPWQQHYISYGADPEVDRFYHELSMLVAPTRQGFDSFPQNATFGGLSFFKYIECVRVLMSFALKHMDFCFILCGKHPEINLIDVMSVPSDWRTSVQCMSYALDVSENEAQQLLLSTTLTPENAEYHLRVPEGPLACQYMIASGSAVRLTAGCLGNPFQFLLRELRRKYRSDWDKSVEHRENIFRRDLCDVFSLFNGVAIFTDSVNISASLGKTDIDVLAVDLVANVAGIFQLKWQDAFGASMRERESKKENFLHTANTWVARVSRWVEEGKMPEVLVSLGMPKAHVAKIQDVRLFVLGRNFSHFSGDSPMDRRAAWGSWAQVLRLLETKAAGKSPITILHDQLISDSPLLRAKKPSGAEEVRIPELTLVYDFGGR